MGVEYRRTACPGAPGGEVWDVFRDGRFITGAASEDLAHQDVDALDAAKWQYLDCARVGFSPLELVENVQSKGWHCRIRKLERSGHGRHFFEGLVDEPPIRFRYLVLDNQMFDAIEQAVRRGKQEGQQAVPAEPAAPPFTPLRPPVVKPPATRGAPARKGGAAVKENAKPAEGPQRKKRKQPDAQPAGEGQSGARGKAVKQDTPQLSMF